MCRKIGFLCTWICWVVSRYEGNSSNTTLDHYYTGSHYLKKRNIVIYVTELI